LYNTLIKKIKISGKYLWPIIEGGKGIGASDAFSAGKFSKFFATGTFSGANPKYIDENGVSHSIEYKAKNRIDRHAELVEFSIKGGISQARVANEIDFEGNGAIHMNILWEMGGAVKILEGILDGCRKKFGKNLIHGVTAGAGMPYKLAEICSHYSVFYYPIVSSMRAFAILWKRAYSGFKDFLGGVVYEDPWLAGGHNGLSNKEDPLKPQDPKPRIAELRKFMNESGLNEVPIIMAGGVWNLKDWKDFIDNEELGPIAFQFGTRPLLTKESPISEAWKKKLMTIKKGDVFLNNFSPTGFYSSAVRNQFIENLIQRSERQIEFSRTKTDVCDFEYEYFVGDCLKKKIYIKSIDKEKVLDWVSKGFSEFMRTPSETIIFVSPEEKKRITSDQIGCMGCLSHCKFSNWKDHENFTIGALPDPRSFCIQKTLQNAINTENIENELMFSGHNGFKFASDPYYANGFIPTIEQLIQRILEEPYL
jgi:nitronate monooxygenase